MSLFPQPNPKRFPLVCHFAVTTVMAYHTSYANDTCTTAASWDCHNTSRVDHRTHLYLPLVNDPSESGDTGSEERFVESIKVYTRRDYDRYMKSLVVRAKDVELAWHVSLRDLSISQHTR